MGLILLAVGDSTKTYLLSQQSLAVPLTTLKYPTTASDF